MKQFISIIIPTYCRPRRLDLCLARLHAQTCSRDDFEVIVIDDGGSPELDNSLPEQHADLSLTLLRIENSGAAVARNHGAKMARGSLLVFTDDDCLPEPEWLAAFAQSHERNPTALLGGSISNGFPSNIYSTCSQLILDCAYAFYNQDSNDARFFASCNIAVPASTFHQVGGFSQTFRIASEDRELCDRWHSAGHPLVYVPTAKLEHAKKLDLPGFMRQHFNYGQGAFQFHRSRSRRGSARWSTDIVRYPMFLAMLFRSVLKLPARQIVPVFFLLLLAQIVNLLGFIRAALFARGDS